MQYDVLVTFLGPEDWPTVTNVCFQFRELIREHQQELMLVHLVRGPRVLRTLLEYKSFQQDIREVYALPGLEQQAASSRLRRQMTRTLEVISTLQAHAVGVRDCFLPFDTAVFPLPRPPLPPQIEALFFPQRLLGEQDDATTISLHHLSAMLLFINVFDIHRSRVTDIVNDFAFWCRSFGADQKSNALVDPEDSPLSIEDISTMRAFTCCQNPMFSAIESILRKLGPRARTSVVQKMGDIMARCAAVVRQLGNPGFTVELEEKGEPAAQEDCDPYLTVLTAAMVLTDRLLHSLHTCPLQEGHTGHTAAAKRCMKGILSFKHPNVSVEECVALVANQSSAAGKEPLLAMLRYSMRTPPAQMEEFLALYAPN